jgi:hypothetical protein
VIYIAAPKNYNNYTVTDELQNEIGTISYSGWRPSSARITAADHHIYDLNTVGFWQQTIEVLRDGIPYASMKLRVGMGMLVTLTFDNGQSFYFKRKEFWSGLQKVTNDEDLEVAVIDNYYRWKKWAFEYELDLKIRPSDPDMYVVLPLLLLYASRLIRIRRGAA